MFTGACQKSELSLDQPPILGEDWVTAGMVFNDFCESTGLHGWKYLAKVNNNKPIHPVLTDVPDGWIYTYVKVKPEFAENYFFQAKQTLKLDVMEPCKTYICLVDAAFQILKLKSRRKGTISSRFPPGSDQFENCGSEFEWWSGRILILTVFL